VSLQWTAAASPSERPSVAAGQPLVDVEPRVSASFGIVFRPREPVRDAPLPAEAPEPIVDRTPPPAVVVTQGAVRGHVTSRSGAPLAGAKVTLRPASGEARVVETDDAGAFELADLPLGSATIDVEAKGFSPASFTVVVDPNTPSDASTSLDRVLPSAQIRGVVRDFAGKAVAATVVIEPLGTTATVNADGSFEIDVPPGTYEVVIKARGYAPQRRRAVVEKDGVTLLNVDLRRGR
jgi:hypothetical protein